MHKSSWTLFLALGGCGSVGGRLHLALIKQHFTHARQRRRHKRANNMTRFFRSLVSSLYGEFRNSTSLVSWDVKWRNNTTVNVQLTVQPDGGHEHSRQSDDNPFRNH